MNLQVSVNAEMKECIEKCLECHSICVDTLSYCLQKGGKHAEAAHIKLLQDCAEICQTGANFMLRDSTLHAKVCGVCATVCEACEESCSDMGEDAQMKKCADVCRACGDLCLTMSEESSVKGGRFTREQSRESRI